MNFFGELLLNLRERTYFVVVKLFVILCFYDLFYGFFFDEFSIWTYFVLCWFACLFVCLLFFEEAERRELRVEGEWGTPEGNRNESRN